MINIVYSGNSKVFEGITLSVLSLIKHTNADLHIYILTMDLSLQKAEYTPITEKQMDILNDIIKEKNPNNVASLIDFTDTYLTTMLKSKNKNTEYTPYAMIRLYLDIVDGLPEKLIYTDVDTMCTADIAQLYDIDISNYEYGAVLDHMGHIFIAPRYINSGVLLLNMNMIKETKLFERSRELVRTRWMKLADQSAINRLAKKKLYLPRRFNEQRSIKEDTVIKHFCKGIKFFPLFYIYNYKQWNREKVHKKLKIHDFDDIYEKYDQLKTKYDLL